MIKHIFCDLDGTLYNHGAISKEDIDAINEIRNSGVIFHIATGRNFHNTKIITKDLDIQGYYITQNGSYIFDKNFELVSKHVIDDNVCKKVMHDFVSEDAVMYVKFGEELVVLGDKIDSPYIRECTYDKDFASRESFENKIGNLGVASNNVEELARIELFYKDKYRDVLDVYFSSEHTINLVPFGASKKQGILDICDIYGVSTDEIATIGDSPNDICMLEATKNSFVIETARDYVKECAKYKVKSVKEAIDIIRDMNK